MKKFTLILSFCAFLAACDMENKHKSCPVVATENVPATVTSAFSKKYPTETATPAWFNKDNPLRSGWLWGQAYLKNGVTAFEAVVGKGKLFAFGPEITFRAQSYGTFKLLFNQLYSN